MSAYEKAVRATEVQTTVQSNHLRVTVSTLQTEEPTTMSRSVRVGFHWDHGVPYTLTQDECSQLQGILADVLSEMSGVIKRAFREKYEAHCERMCLAARKEAEAILALSEQETTP